MTSFTAVMAARWERGFSVVYSIGMPVGALTTQNTLGNNINIIRKDEYGNELHGEDMVR